MWFHMSDHAQIHAIYHIEPETRVASLHTFYCVDLPRSLQPTGGIITDQCDMLD